MKQLVPEDTAKLIALTAIYLSEGATRMLALNDFKQTEETGHLGFMATLVDHAQAAAEWMKSNEWINDGPGVFHYEVVEDLGAWIVNNTDATRHEVIKQLAKLANEYHTRNNHGSQPPVPV